MRGIKGEINVVVNACYSIDVADYDVYFRFDIPKKTSKKNKHDIRLPYVKVYAK